jgi:hypothetical protein
MVPQGNPQVGWALLVSFPALGMRSHLKGVETATAAI